ncbi:MAG: DNA-binding protein [Rhizomicrobium sp.]|jgi:transcriptional regulator with XRE-family HTH domain
MALFFDATWFDAKLRSLGLGRAHVAQALGIDEQELALVWKDQREVSARDVAVLAALLGVAPADIATHAGISTPVPERVAAESDAVSEMNARLVRIERELADIKSMLLDLRSEK